MNVEQVVPKYFRRRTGNHRQLRAKGERKFSLTWWAGSPNGVTRRLGAIKVMGTKIEVFRAFTLAIGALFVGSAPAQQPYLDAANTRQPSKDASLPSITHHGFPRTLAHELSVGVGAEAYSRYHFIDAHGSMVDKVEQVQSLDSPDTMMLRHIGARD